MKIEQLREEIAAASRSCIVVSVLRGAIVASLLTLWTARAQADYFYKFDFNQLLELNSGNVFEPSEIVFKSSTFAPQNPSDVLTYASGNVNNCRPAAISVVFVDFPPGSGNVGFANNPNLAPPCTPNGFDGVAGFYFTAPGARAGLGSYFTPDSAGREFAFDSGGAYYEYTSGTLTISQSVPEGSSVSLVIVWLIVASYFKRYS